MRDWIRRMKWLYMLYNVFHRSQLYHNVSKYRKLRMSKFYFSPVSSRDFEGIDPAILATETAQKSGVQQSLLYRELNEKGRLSLDQYEQNGFAILNEWIDPVTVDRINASIERMLNAGEVKFKYRNKIMFAIHKEKMLMDIGLDTRLIDLLTVLMRGPAVLFQSINFIMGSEQKTHSDSIHMTTFPSGGLIGVWIALEDIDEENGPLHYYPGSHKLPYYLNKDYDNEGNCFFLGANDYTTYEQMLAEKVTMLGLKKAIFKAKKGDVLLWHANLLHGGEPHIDKSRTRKSVVFHYYNGHAVCYHEISQRPALIRPIQLT